MIRLVIRMRGERGDELYCSQFRSMDDAGNAYRNWLRRTGIADKDVICEYQEV